MSEMFRMNDVFNQDLSNWNVSGVTSMREMFDGAISFNQDLSSWCVSKINSKPNAFNRNANSNWVNASSMQPEWGVCNSNVTSNNTDTDFRYKSNIY